MAADRSRTTDARTRRRRILALLSGGLVLGIGGTMTLASWNDTEWAWAGAGSLPGVVTSEFVVYQNTQTPRDGLGTTDWVERPTNPGDGLVFEPLTAGDELDALTPGETFYAPVALKTSDESIGGTVSLHGAVAAAAIADPAAIDPDGLLWDNLRVRVALQTQPSADPAPACDATAFSSGTVIVGADGATALDTAGVADRPLAGAGAEVQYYCFELALPDNPVTQTLQGRAVGPAWEFVSTSR